jgi:hypothetical protein
MNITSAQYTTSIISGENDSITVVSNGVTMSVPLDPDNTDYAAILEWAEEDGNEIQAAE